MFETPPYGDVNFKFALFQTEFGAPSPLRRSAVSEMRSNPFPCTPDRLNLLTDDKHAGTIAPPHGVTADNGDVSAVRRQLAEDASERSGGAGRTAGA